MSLPNVILSLLREPMSGTDLIRLFKGTFSHFWQTDLSQIYRALESLEKEKCLVSESVPSPRGPARRVYRLTTRGQARLLDWIRQPAAIPPAKFEYLAQIFSATADAEPRERAREILLSMRGDAAAGVEILEAIVQQMRQGAGEPESMPDFLFYPWLTLQHGLLRRRALLAWIDASLLQLDRRPPGGIQGGDGEAMSQLVQVLKMMMGENRSAGPPGSA